MAVIPWSLIHLAIAGYAYFQSTFTAFFILSAVTVLLRIFYRVALYPVYFTPLKQIPTPAVSCISAILGPATHEASVANLTTYVAPIMVHWQPSHICP